MNKTKSGFTKSEWLRQVQLLLDSQKVDLSSVGFASKRPYLLAFFIPYATSKANFSSFENFMNKNSFSDCIAVYLISFIDLTAEPLFYMKKVSTGFSLSYFRESAIAHRMNKQKNAIQQTTRKK